MMDISEFVKIKNQKKEIFTPGPGPLLEENVLGLGPAFGRGDSEYDITEASVLDGLKNFPVCRKLFDFRVQEASP